MWGGRLLVASILVVLWGTLFKDLLIITFGLCGLLLLGYRYWKLRISLLELPEQIVLDPTSLNDSFTAGDYIRTDIKINYSGDGAPRLRSEYGSFEPSLVRPGEQAHVFRFKPELAANYEFNSINSLLEDELNLLNGETELGFSLSCRVYPRVLSVALDALRYLEGQGVLGAGEQTSIMKGRGYEYADSREYVEGDSLMQIDWKATARLAKLIVKEYYMEGSGSIHIVYDTRISDPVSADILASEYLKTILSFAERGWVIGLTILDDMGKVSSYFPELYPRLAVSIALRHVLNTRLLEARSFFDVLDPLYNTRLRKVMERSLPDSSGGFNELKEAVYRSVYGGILYISCMSGNPSSLMELSHIAHISRTRFVVFEPCNPWRYLGLGAGYKVLNHVNRTNRSLRHEGVPIAVNLNEAQEKLGMLEPSYL